MMPPPGRSRAGGSWNRAPCLGSDDSGFPGPFPLISDDPQVGRLLTWQLSRREALSLLSASGIALLARPLAGSAATATGGPLPACIARPQQTAGPFFVDEAL